MQNKVTAKDVAAKAGVSVATVSYVMNGRTDQKISPETKKKVLQIANLLNYVPSHAAKVLATGRNNAIGISFSVSESPVKNASITRFAALLTERMQRMKYDVTLIPARINDGGLPVNRNIDAIIAIDLRHDDFRRLADNYLVPVICVDMIVNDSLFYQIYEDIPFLVEKAMLSLGEPKKAYFIYNGYDNSFFEEFMLKLPQNVFPLRSSDISENVLCKLKQENVIILDCFLALTLMPYLDCNKTSVILSENEKSLLPSDVHTIYNNETKKANLTMNIVMNALDRNFEVTHNHIVR